MRNWMRRLLVGSIRTIVYCCVMAYLDVRILIGEVQMHRTLKRLEKLTNEP